MTPEEEVSSGAEVVSEGSVVLLSLVDGTALSDVAATEEAFAEVLSEEVLSERKEVTERLVSPDFWLWHALTEKSENKTELASKNERDFLNFFMGQIVTSFRRFQISSGSVLDVISVQSFVLKKHLPVGSNQTCTVEVPDKVGIIPAVHVRL